MTTTPTSPLARRDDERHRHINDRTLREQLRARPGLLARMLRGADPATRDRLRSLGFATDD